MVQPQSGLVLDTGTAYTPPIWGNTQDAVDIILNPPALPIYGDPLPTYPPQAPASMDPAPANIPQAGNAGTQTPPIIAEPPTLPTATAGDGTTVTLPNPALPSVSKTNWPLLIGAGALVYFLFIRKK